MDMLIWTAKVDRRKVRLLLGGVLVICLAVAGVMLRGVGAQAAAFPDAKGIKTQEDRADYLQQWGWVVSGDPVSVEELQMPDSFGEEYNDYLTLQTGQGFDLGKFAGKRVKRYTYDLLNYPGGGKAQAHLLLYKNRVIAGEVLGEGFLHGLATPG